MQPTLSPDVDATNREYGRQVQRFDTSLPRPAVESASPGSRGEIRTRGTNIRGQTGAAAAEFDTKAEIVKTPDGTLASRKSLLKQTGEQVVEDAGVSLDAAKDTVKYLLRRK
jgi:conjugal transfer mating pair stabilization protein TraG